MQYEFRQKNPPLSPFLSGPLPSLSVCISVRHKVHELERSHKCGAVPPSLSICSMLICLFCVKLPAVLSQLSYVLYRVTRPSRLALTRCNSTLFLPWSCSVPPRPWIQTGLPSQTSSFSLCCLGSCRPLSPHPTTPAPDIT